MDPRTPPGRSARSPTTVARAEAAWATRVREGCARRRSTLLRLVRYCGVSVVSTVASLVILGLLVGPVGLVATWSNVIATAVGTVPSFELNRRWVWNLTGRRPVLGQIVPFCALSLTGLVVSTVAVGTVSVHTSAWGRRSHTAALLGANLAAYGTLWVLQYQLLNRRLFKAPTDRSRTAGGSDLPAGGQTALSLSGPVGRRLGDGGPAPRISAQGRNDHG